MLALIFVLTEVADGLTMLVIPLDAEVNPIPHLFGAGAALLLKAAGTAFVLWLAFRIPNDVLTAGALATGIVFGSIGAGSNISVILGMWRYGLL